MITRCSSCLGKKTIIGLGSLIQDCPKCDGIGHIKVVLDHDDALHQAKTIQDSISIDLSKKRGRPKNDRKKESRATNHIQ